MGPSVIQDWVKTKVCAKLQVEIQLFRHPHLVLMVRIIVSFFVDCSTYGTVFGDFETLPPNRNN